MGICFEVQIICFWPLFGTIRKPCPSTFRIILPFLDSIRIIRATPKFSTPFFAQIKLNSLYLYCFAVLVSLVHLQAVPLAGTLTSELVVIDETDYLKTYILYSFNWYLSYFDLIWVLKACVLHRDP